MLAYGQTGRRRCWVLTERGSILHVNFFLTRFIAVFSSLLHWSHTHTASGKTYTMGSSSNLHLSEEDYGIIPRVVDNIFLNIQKFEARFVFFVILLALACADFLLL